MPTNVKDPRSIITPDAFEVSPALLGLPLATPSRRLSAILIDLALIGILTALLSGVQLMLWGTLALILVYTSLRRPKRPAMGPHASMLLRTSLGCLGTGILGVVLLVVGMSWWRGRQPSDEQDGEGLRSSGVPAAVAGLIRSGGELAQAAEDLGEAKTHAEAERAALTFLQGMPELGMSRERRLEMLLGMTPEDADWRERAEEIYARALDAVEGGARDPQAGTPSGEGGERTDGVAPVATAEQQHEVPADSLTEQQALAELAALSAAGLPEEETPQGARALALRRRLLPLVGADTLETLEGALERERDERSELEGQVAEMTEEGTGVVGLLRDVWDQLGSAIGLWSLYFTVLLTLWKGQTVGKRLVGIRVLRLDGEPLTWWSSFERVGGYAAGIATGLLGFAQVFWDANRQCVHDKIVGTVVVVAGAPPVPDSWIEARPTGSRAAGPHSKDEEA